MINKILHRLGIHNWYYGNYVSPVYAGWERRCMNCPRTMYRSYKNNIWVGYEE